MELTKKRNDVTLSIAIFVIFNALSLISNFFFNAKIHSVLLLLGATFSVVATVKINKTVKNNGGNLLRTNLIWFLSVLFVGVASLITFFVLKSFKVNAVPFLLSVECFQLAALLSVFFCYLGNVKKPSKYLIISSIFCLIMAVVVSICIEIDVLNTGTAVIFGTSLVSYAITSVQYTAIMSKEKFLYKFIIQLLRILLTTIVVYFITALPVFIWGRSWDINNTTSAIVVTLTFSIILATTLITELVLIFVRKCRYKKLNHK